MSALFKILKSRRQNPFFFTNAKCVFPASIGVRKAQLIGLLLRKTEKDIIAKAFLKMMWFRTDIIK